MLNQTTEMNVSSLRQYFSVALVFGGREDVQKAFYNTGYASLKQIAVSLLQFLSAWIAICLRLAYPPKPKPY